LSFALTEGEEMWTPPGEPTSLGDIIISVETARRQAERGALPRLKSGLPTHREWSVRDEVSFLALHGLLHLLGFDHEEETDAEEMEALELALLPCLLGLRAQRA
jgi:probable rRNA maturation factor